jgi:hypothetical protein
MYPIIGPDGWNGQILSPFVFQEFPPYPTVRTSTDTTGRLSGSVPFSSRSIVPISIFGNYTFCVRNGGNTTMQISFRITTPIVTLETRPLTVGSYPAWDPDFATERIVRIREESGGNQSYPTLSATIPDTTTTALNTVALEILCTVALGALSIFVINHKKTLRTTLEKMT